MRRRPDAKSVIARIDKQYGVHYSVSGVTYLLHRLGFSYKKPTTGFYDTINADSTIDLFSKIEAKHPNAKTIYIIVDNARYYRSCLLKEYTEGAKIKLIFLETVA